MPFATESHVLNITDPRRGLTTQFQIQSIEERNDTQMVDHHVIGERTVRRIRGAVRNEISFVLYDGQGSEILQQAESSDESYVFRVGDRTFTGIVMSVRRSIGAQDNVLRTHVVVAVTGPVVEDDTRLRDMDGNYERDSANDDDAVDINNTESDPSYDAFEHLTRPPGLRVGRAIWSTGR